MSDSEPIRKHEYYAQIGGVNLKSSKYVTSDNECLNIKNLDFDTLGSLSSVPGYTQFLTTGATSPITGLVDFFAGVPTYRIANSVTYTQPAGAFTYQVIATTRHYAANISANSVSTFYSYLYADKDNPFSFAVAQNRTYGANQYDFFTYPQIGGTGINSYQGYTNNGLQYSLPAPQFDVGVLNFVSGVSNASGVSGIISLAASFVRGDGLVGPAAFATFGPVGGAAYGFTTFIVRNAGFFSPNYNGDGSTFFGSWGFTLGSFNIVGMYFWFNYSGDDPTRRTSAFYLNTSAIGTTIQINPSSGSYPADAEEPVPNALLGSFIDPDVYLSTATRPFNPSTIAVFKNQLFMGGFLSDRSRIWVSEIGQYELRDPESSFLFRDNDGDIVSCLMPYYTQLVIFKNNSIGLLSGDDPGNFDVDEVSTQYGCISSAGACVWEQRLWFLDKEGIAEFNGANTKIVSDKVDEIFRRMNVVAAQKTASMVYLKERNQVWTYIPVDGSETNNIAVIYDHLIDSWTFKDVSRGTAAAVLSRGTTHPIAHYGDFSGMIYNFSPTFLLNNGSAVTYVIQSKFIRDIGNSDQKMNRRLWLDATVPPGCTYNFEVNFYKDQGTTPALRTTMTLSEFQDRIDFPLSAKSISVEFIHVGTSFLQINGFTIGDRFLRAV